MLSTSIASPTGFVLDDNRSDLLMVSCPLPPQAEWDDVMSARMELLAHRGLAPRIFLPASRLDGKTCALMGPASVMSAVSACAGPNGVEEGHVIDQSPRLPPFDRISPQADCQHSSLPLTMTHYIPCPI